MALMSGLLVRFAGSAVGNEAAQSGTSQKHGLRPIPPACVVQPSRAPYGEIFVPLVP